jgi:head-tail adaptor
MLTKWEDCEVGWAKLLGERERERERAADASCRNIFWQGEQQLQLRKRRYGR